MQPLQVIFIVMCFGVFLYLILLGVFRVAAKIGAPAIEADLAAANNMSSSEAQNTPSEGVAAPVAQPATEAAQLIARPCNDANAELTRNAEAQRLPDEVRDIIRRQALAEAVATLLKEKRLSNKAEAIELVFGPGHGRNSRAGSKYMQALTMVDALLSPVAQRGDGTFVERATGEALFAAEEGQYRTRDGRLIEA